MSLRCGPSVAKVNCAKSRGLNGGSVAGCETCDGVPGAGGSPGPWRCKTVEELGGSTKPGGLERKIEGEAEGSAAEECLLDATECVGEVDLELVRERGRGEARWSGVF